MPQNVRIAHVSGMISVRVIESILPKIGVVEQDNITQGGTYLSRMEGGVRDMLTHTHTHDIDYLILLLRDI